MQGMMTCGSSALQTALELAKFLQMTIIFRQYFALVFRRFTRVAAPMLRFASAQCPVRSLFDQPPGAPLCELRVRSVPRGQQSMSPSAEGEAGASEDCIRNCKECSSNRENAPSVTCTLHWQGI